MDDCQIIKNGDILKTKMIFRTCQIILSYPKALLYPCLWSFFAVSERGLNKVCHIHSYSRLLQVTCSSVAQYLLGMHWVLFSNYFLISYPVQCPLVYHWYVRRMSLHFAILEIRGSSSSEFAYQRLEPVTLNELWCRHAAPGVTPRPKLQNQQKMQQNSQLNIISLIYVLLLLFLLLLPLLSAYFDCRSSTAQHTNYASTAYLPQHHKN